MNSVPKYRPSIEKRLALPRYAELWKVVETAFANQYWEDERDYWDFAYGLRDSWNIMSKAPAKEVMRNVADIANQAQSLANKILAFSPEIRTLKGYLKVDIHSFLAEDLANFADSLKEDNFPTEAMLSRPRSMALKTAERTYMARSLTHFLIQNGIVSGKAISKRSALVAMTVNALLDIGAEDEFDAKDVDDLTKDIVSCYKNRKYE